MTSNSKCCPCSFSAEKTLASHSSKDVHSPPATGISYNQASRVLIQCGLWIKPFQKLTPWTNFKNRNYFLLYNSDDTKKMYFVFIEFFHTTKTFDRTLLNWNTIGPGMGTTTENKIINIVPWHRTILTHWLRLPSSSCPSTAGVEPQVSLDVDWKQTTVFGISN